ncbi:uncharacterized protein EI90DRAFT_3039173, partial [Cantharellus anzutake]|uniref:uncharacterized protein n=1 Tax=Cantharellus anzutake TaxID=1750568 RepID=UPI00190343D8
TQVLVTCVQWFSFLFCTCDHNPPVCQTMVYHVCDVTDSVGTKDTSKSSILNPKGADRQVTNTGTKMTISLNIFQSGDGCSNNYAISVRHSKLINPILNGFFECSAL